MTLQDEIIKELGVKPVIDPKEEIRVSVDFLKDYLKKYPLLDEFVTKAVSMLDFVASVYCATGKKQLHIAVGCTGGRHRSVALAEAIAKSLKKSGVNVKNEHRDIDKGTLS